MSMHASRRRMWIGVVALALAVAVASEAWARPGGGQSYGGGGGGGGGGGDDSGLISLLIQLIVWHPAIGVPVTIVVIGGWIWLKRQRGVSQSWDSGMVRPQTVAATADLAVIHRIDPDFSAVLFEDFVFRLFATAHRARNDPRALAALAPYVSDAARAHLAQRPPVGQPIDWVVVGAMRPIRVTLPRPSPPGSPPGYVHVALELEANLSSAQQTTYTVEHWTLVRSAEVRTRPPQAGQSFACPSCGAPYASGDAQRCDHCGQQVTEGRFDWSVQSIALLRSDARGPSLTRNVAEQGTELPTVVHPQLAVRWSELQASDPEVTPDRLFARLSLVYDQLNASWTRCDLRPARPFVSDGLFDYLRYWTDAYRRQGLRNVLERMRITNWTITKVVLDRWFAAVTVRLWATGLDYTVEATSGKVLSGSPRRERVYSEYWTLVRAAGRRGAPRVDPNCPSCGAPLQISTAGTCDHCGSHITGGEFDWVLSKIEQDDSYRG